VSSSPPINSDVAGFAILRGGAAASAPWEGGRSLGAAVRPFGRMRQTRIGSAIFFNTRAPISS
jgi:hypothetical protein